VQPPASSKVVSSSRVAPNQTTAQLTSVRSPSQKEEVTKPTQNITPAREPTTAPSLTAPQSSWSPFALSGASSAITFELASALTFRDQTRSSLTPSISPLLSHSLTPFLPQSSQATQNERVPQPNEVSFIINNSAFGGIQAGTTHLSSPILRSASRASAMPEQSNDLWSSSIDGQVASAHSSSLSFVPGDDSYFSSSGSYFYGAPSENIEPQTQHHLQQLPPITSGAAVHSNADKSNEAAASRPAAGSWAVKLKIVSNGITIPAEMSNYPDPTAKNQRENLHSSGSGSSQLCKFFLQGACRYGASCFYRHALGTCNEVTNDEHAAQCEDIRLAHVERQESAGIECGICYENVIAACGRFGLLSHCNHAFCLPCIREWRGQSGDAKRETVRSCPLCREESHFVIPCDRMLSDPARKQRAVDDYKFKMGQIECKHYNRGESVCPFGTSCFYAHINKDGTREEAPVLRSRIDADGNVEIVSESKLSDFFFGFPLE
jgi:E3 ubiquitin-protein ligase makorin